MSIVITTPTGNVGGRIAASLVEQGHEVTLVARDKQKVADLAAKGARIIEGSHSDPELLISATKGADALFLATPPNLVSEDIVAFYKTFGNAAARAISANKIDRVVQLSSVGAEQPNGTGPIVGLYENEKILNHVASHIVHLRPGYFMENTLMQIPTVSSMNQMFTTLGGDSMFPMIATQDIAARAAVLLVDKEWQGQQIVELMGPADMSYNKVGSILSELTGRAITHQTVPGEALIESLLQMGASKHIAECYLELYDAVDSGHVHFHGVRDDQSRTPTAFQEFAESVFLPALSQV